MPSKKQNTSLPREEDYRDFEERNIRDGWPYSDQPDAASSKPKNRAYGEPEANFDREQKSGFSIEGKEEVGTDSQLTSRNPDSVDHDLRAKPLWPATRVPA
ncbi:hypothetical protein QN219_02040 [Sinorhizobium sp. 7-81]|uniref:hypothetical protein n=1 Tax=Sinorhizobium sp. 8-89 TaxID=3049089 RepID=UPI0024C22AD0|nr:hypothetical protein [Sinorhizobium sp. 8-89]MDK1488841.1 hypothetical protein [Sinorhizobium sp. 8-89]